MSPPNSCPGESCGMAEVKNSRPPSSMVPAISESKMRGESKPGSGSDDGKGSSVEAMATARRCPWAFSRSGAVGGREEGSAYRLWSLDFRSCPALEGAGVGLRCRSAVSKPWHFGHLGTPAAGTLARQAQRAEGASLSDTWQWMTDECRRRESGGRRSGMSSWRRMRLSWSGGEW